MGFDEYAKNWDTDKRIKRAKTIVNEIVKSINTERKYSAMEFGCGTGLVSFNMYDKFKKITLIDSSKGMIDILNAKILEYNVSNMVTKHLDITGDDTIAEKFDIIYTSMVLHHIHDTEGIIKKLYQLLNDEGCLCIVDLNEEDGSFHKEYSDYDGHNGFNQDELKMILVEAGFEGIESNTFFHDVKIIGDENINYSLFLMKGIKHGNNL